MYQYGVELNNVNVLYNKLTLPYFNLLGFKDDRTGAV